MLHPMVLELSVCSLPTPVEEIKTHVTKNEASAGSWPRDTSYICHISPLANFL